MFRKAFSILELEERKDRRVVKQDFHGNYQVNVIYIYIIFFCFVLFFFFFLPFSPVVLILVWVESSSPCKS